MMIDKRLINTVADSKKWIGVTVLWNWVALVVGWALAHQQTIVIFWWALVVVGWASAHQQTIARYFGGLKPTLR
ncbi:ABC transporter ATP-binding protein [Haemophilus influenzae]|nr:ABC transporter [Haemophilus influenzae]BCB15459.1 hypothetical protein JPHIA_03590 [Haemophilus influenzae]SQK92778.1 ABC transporter ATP-binding protein [Haemophilus influenzae]